jgi:hypothetical protein
LGFIAAQVVGALFVILGLRKRNLHE